MQAKFPTKGKSGWGFSEIENGCAPQTHNQHYHLPELPGTFYDYTCPQGLDFCQLEFKIYLD